MKEPTDKIDIWTESAIFDYVAGHLSDGARAEFEARMASDPSLRDAVERERTLRDQIIASDAVPDESDPVIAANSIEDLFSRIDQLEQDSSSEGLPGESAQLNTAKRNWLRIVGVAASIAIAAVFVVNQQPNTSNNDFTLLSNQPTDQQSDFGKLVEAKRVAQIWFAQDVTPSDANKLLERYKLSQMGHAGPAWIVAAQTPFANDSLSRLSSTPEIERISLISFNGEEQ